jgi:hypothetical protein
MLIRQRSKLKEFIALTASHFGRSASSVRPVQALTSGSEQSAERQIPNRAVGNEIIYVGELVGKSFARHRYRKRTAGIGID